METQTQWIQYRTMPFCEINGARLYYERSGAGPALVLVHGSWVDCRSWDAVVPDLSRSFDLIRYDRRGHSRSSGASGRAGVGDDVDDLGALIDLLELDQVCVAGASFGGSIALRLASARPQLLGGVAAHEPPLFDLLEGDAGHRTELAQLRARLAAVGSLLESGDLEGGTRCYFDRVTEGSGGWSALDPARRRDLIANAPAYLDHYRDPDALEMDLEGLAAFSGTGLVTYGDRRPPLFRRIVDLVVAALPARRAELIPGTAHDPQVTHPASYVRALESLAAQLAGMEAR